MHAVIGAVDIDSSRAAEAETMLRETLVPMIKQMRGFVSGTWARSADGSQGRSMILFESEDAAKDAAKTVTEGPPSGAPVTFVSVDVFEVVAQA